jgi:hypothetical protein
MTGKLVGAKFFLKGPKGWEEVTEKEWRKVMRPPPLNLTAGAGLVGWKAQHSEALAVHPQQIKQAADDAAAKGVPTDFDGAGRPILTSRSHRRAYHLAYGVIDKDAGYSDAQPGQSWRDIPKPLSGEALAQEYDW